LVWLGFAVSAWLQINYFDNSFLAEYVMACIYPFFESHPL